MVTGSCHKVESRHVLCVTVGVLRHLGQVPAQPFFPPLLRSILLSI